jgi:hypothetical protein
VCFVGWLEVTGGALVVVGCVVGGCTVGAVVGCGTGACVVPEFGAAVPPVVLP